MPGPIPEDLELGRLYVNDLRSLCSRLNLASRRASLSRSAHTSTIHCPRVAEQGNRKGRIRRRSNRSQRLQWLFSASNRHTIARRVPCENDAPQISSPGTSASLANNHASDTAMDSVHELPAKLVKEIQTGEFMELCKLLPKNFNVLNPSQDEPITLTLENSIIRVNKAKATSITDIAEWTTTFTAYMGVIISKFPHRASEHLEYMSLIRYAAKYHRGLDGTLPPVSTPSPHKTRPQPSISVQALAKEAEGYLGMSLTQSTKKTHGSAVTLAFYGFLRIGELTRNSTFDPKHHLMNRDIYAKEFTPVYVSALEGVQNRSL
ncbi:hypothetical protein ACROYT_G041300 [Oculina patagonica]